MIRKRARTYQLYNEFCLARNFRPANGKIFKHALMGHFPMISAATGLGGYDCLKFVPRKVQAHAKSKGWVRG